MRNWRFFFIGCLLVVALLLASQPAAAQMGDGRYFPETNKWVRGDFLKFYLQIPNVDLLLGYPISDELQDVGRRVQYFERGRIDQINNGNGIVMKLANLGSFMIEQNDKLADVPQASVTCRFFPKTGKSVCFEFLKFFDAYGGEKYFGNPLTNIIIFNGGFAQYFENARLEFRANMPLDKQIIIADLGREAYMKYVGGLPPKPVERQPGRNVGSNTLLNDLHTHAYVGTALAQALGKQTVFVVVHDRDSKPVEGAKVNLTLEYPGGQKQVLATGQLTNADGIFKATFVVENLNIDDIVKVQVQAEYLGETFIANTWFRIWY